MKEVLIEVLLQIMKLINESTTSKMKEVLIEVLLQIMKSFPKNYILYY